MVVVLAEVAMASRDPETRRVVLAVLRWERLREVHLQDHLSQIPTDADADHSALLARLLAGEEPFLVPPPTSHSYPWYELVENGWAIAGCEAWNSMPQEYERLPGFLHFQQSLWEIDSRFEANGHPAWNIHHKHGWRATVAWEQGPFKVGYSIVPSPHDLMQPAYIVHLLDWPPQSVASHP